MERGGERGKTSRM